MKTYYGILRQQPAWVLIEAESLGQAKRLLTQKYDADILMVKRATPKDIEFVEWCDTSEEARRTKLGDTREQGLARLSGGDEGTTEEPVPSGEWRDNTRCVP